MSRKIFHLAKIYYVEMGKLEINKNMSYYQPENPMEQNENNFINKDVKNGEN